MQVRFTKYEVHNGWLVCLSELSAVSAIFYRVPHKDMNELEWRYFVNRT